MKDEMLKYAREDTHYLLYIYDVLRKELLESGTAKNPENPRTDLKAVIHRSSSLCLQAYEKPVTKDFKYSMTIANARGI